jgi:hypothetical protein
MSAQRVKIMIERFEMQEKLKQEILERERQIKRLESRKEEEELKHNIHKKYLRTKYRDIHGHSKWSRENSEEVVNKMYNRRHDKKNKIEKHEKERKNKIENELKSYFKPQILSSTKSWENLKKNEYKINKRIDKKEMEKAQRAKQLAEKSKERFYNENQNTVYSRMESDLEQRRERERKRRQLKKFKDLHFKEY